MCLGWLSFSLIYEDMGVAIDINISPSRFGAPKFHENLGSLPSMRNSPTWLMENPKSSLQLKASVQGGHLKANHFQSVNLRPV